MREIFKIITVIAILGIHYSSSAQGRIRVGSTNGYDSSRISNDTLYLCSNNGSCDFHILPSEDADTFFISNDTLYHKNIKGNTTFSVIPKPLTDNFYQSNDTLYHTNINGNTTFSILPSVDSDSMYFNATGDSITHENINGNKFTYFYGDDSSCVIRNTRAAIRALRTAGSLDAGCHYVITNPSADGNLDVQEVLLHAVNSNTLGTTADILTSHYANAFSGVYDIDQDDVLEVTDNLENHVISNASILNFPFGVTAVNGNEVKNRANVIYTTGNFVNNVVETDATVATSGVNVTRNHFESQSNTTVNSGDFRENRVASDATVISSTTGDVDNNTFGNASNSTISGITNIDDSEVVTDATITVTGGTIIHCKFEQLSNYIMSGGILRETTVGQDADVTIISGDNYENVFGNSTVYRQVGTGYIRYSTIEGSTTWTNGNTNVSNVNSYVSTVNTTGSSGIIANSTWTRAYCPNMQNVTSLTIQDFDISSYGQVNVNGATRVYLYRGSNDGSRVLTSGASSLDASHTHLKGYSYIQSTNGSVFVVNYTNLSGYGYARNITGNSNRIDRCTIGSNSNMRFEGNAIDCRIYYMYAQGSSSVYHTGNSNGCHLYYGGALGGGQIYTNNSVNARIYYSSVDSRGRIIDQNNSNTHYIYYCKASSGGYLYMINNTGLVRMYSVEANSQSIARLQNSSTGNWYYSNFDSYYYAYFTFTTAGTRSGFFGKGRLSKTVTNPVKQNVTLNNYIDNIQ